MDNRNQLDWAISTATLAHLDQQDKAGNPYILHPLHLMSQLLHDHELAAIAVLHDVVEDTCMTMDHLKERFSERIISALELLTHDESMSYDEYIDNICTNKDAIIVKMKDIEHNSDITRLKGVRQKDLDRIEKYHRSYLKLKDALRNYGTTG